MKPYRIALLATGLTAMLAAPAFADWDRVGSIEVDYQLERNTQYGNFGGPVERVQLRAVGNDVACRTITAQFGNGNERDIWRGTLREGRPVTIDMPGNARNLRRLDFTCRATGRHARVEIFADTRGWGGGGSLRTVPPATDWAAAVAERIVGPHAVSGPHAAFTAEELPSLDIEVNP